MPAGAGPRTLWQAEFDGYIQRQFGNFPRRHRERGQCPGRGVATGRRRRGRPAFGDSVGARTRAAGTGSAGSGSGSGFSSRSPYQLSAAAPAARRGDRGARKSASASGQQGQQGRQGRHRQALRFCRFKRLARARDLGTMALCQAAQRAGFAFEPAQPIGRAQEVFRSCIESGHSALAAARWASSVAGTGSSAVEARNHWGCCSSLAPTMPVAAVRSCALARRARPAPRASGAAN